MATAKSIRTPKFDQKAIFGFIKIALIAWVAMYLMGGFKTLLEKIGLAKDPTDKVKDAMDLYLAEKQAKLTKEMLETQEKNHREQIEKVKPTKPLIEWAQVADSIYNALVVPGYMEDESEAMRNLKMPQNQSDVYQLMQTFGARMDYWNAIPSGKVGLKDFLVQNLSEGQIKEINAVWKKRGISYQL